MTDCDMQYFWISGLLYKVSQNCHHPKKSMISDERARESRKCKFEQQKIWIFDVHRKKCTLYNKILGIFI